MKKFFHDFKEFATRGNVIDMAVGMMIGSAFGKIVTSLVNDVLMPLISCLTSGTNFSELKILLRDGGQPVFLNYGAFIQNIIDFLIIAFCIFSAIRIMNRFKKPAEQQVAPVKEDSDELKELKKITKLLEEKK